jgi:hypothetical protein
MVIKNIDHLFITSHSHNICLYHDELAAHSQSINIIVLTPSIDKYNQYQTILHNEITKNVNNNNNNNKDVYNLYCNNYDDTIAAIHKTFIDGLIDSPFTSVKYLNMSYNYDITIPDDNIHRDISNLYVVNYFNKLNPLQLSHSNNVHVDARHDYYYYMWKWYTYVREIQPDTIHIPATNLKYCQEYYNSLSPERYDTKLLLYKYTLILTVDKMVATDDNWKDIHSKLYYYSQSNYIDTIIVIWPQQTPVINNKNLLNNTVYFGGVYKQESSQISYVEAVNVKSNHIYFKSTLESTTTPSWIKHNKNHNNRNKFKFHVSRSTPLLLLIKQRFMDGNSDTSSKEYDRLYGYVLLSIRDISLALQISFSNKSSYSYYYINKCNCNANIEKYPKYVRNYIQKYDGNLHSCHKSHNNNNMYDNMIPDDEHNGHSIIVLRISLHDINYIYPCFHANGLLTSYSWCSNILTVEIVKGYNIGVSNKNIYYSFPSSNNNKYKYLPNPHIRTKSVLLLDSNLIVHRNDLDYAFRIWLSNQNNIIGYKKIDSNIGTNEIDRTSYFDANGDIDLRYVPVDKSNSILPLYNIISSQFLFFDMRYLEYHSCIHPVTANEKYSQIIEFINSSYHSSDYQNMYHLVEDIMFNMITYKYLRSQQSPISISIRDYSNDQNNQLLANDDNYRTYINDIINIISVSLNISNYYPSIVDLGRSEVSYRLLHEELFFKVNQNKNDSNGWNANITEHFMNSKLLRPIVNKMLHYQKVHRPWVGV